MAPSQSSPDPQLGSVDDAADDAAANQPRLPLNSTTLWQGRLLVLAAAVMWSSAAFFAKSPWFEGWPGVNLAMWRAFFVFIFLLPFVRRVQWKKRLGADDHHLCRDELLLSDCVGQD